MGRLCVIEDCAAEIGKGAKGMCPHHYGNWRRWGDPLVTKRIRRTGSVDARFLPRIVRGPPGGCWEWAGSHDPQGYGQFRDGGRLWKAHRFSYEWTIGPIPEGLQLDHLCRNRGCCNPDHLEPVTNAENARRGETGFHMRNRTHCKRGHPFTPENTYVIPSTGSRSCRACRRH
jgi:hypothetical protein